MSQNTSSSTSRPELSSSSQEDTTGRNRGKAKRKNPPPSLTTSTTISSSSSSSSSTGTEPVAENPILAALGATPRGSQQSSDKRSWSENDPRRRSTRSKTQRTVGLSILLPGGTSSSAASSSSSMIKSEPLPVTLTAVNNHPPAILGKRKSSLEDDRNEQQQVLEGTPLEQEKQEKEEGGISSTRDSSGEERLSIDPSERSHHTAKNFRREISIASPAGNEEDEDEAAPCPAKVSPVPQTTTTRRRRPLSSLGFDWQPEDLILYVFSFLIDGEDLFSMARVSKRWRALTNAVCLCRHMRNTDVEDGTINWMNFQNMGMKNKGTEGTCYRARQRSTGKILALKKARVFPKGEGVPYYMLRELAVLQGLVHPNIAKLEMVNLAKDALHVLFPYVDKTLHETINPNSNPNGGRILDERDTRRLLHQLLDAIAYCHRRGVLHRNLKPKHLLIDVQSIDDLSQATLQLSDFALVRATGLPRREYTMEVVTLWYRPPEILMGVSGYSPAVDIWSIGCIFAEMALGKPLFTGISEIDQLFQIFSKLSTPTKESWFAFTNLPNYQFEFPNWKLRPMSKLFPRLSPVGLDLLGQLLTYDPDLRLSAEDALRHPYFRQDTPLFRPLVSHCDIHQHLVHMTQRGIPRRHEHIHLFHQFLRDSEKSMCRDMDYLVRQRMLRPMHRAMLVDWLIEVVDVFEMCLRTAFLAVNYTDRYLNAVMVKKAKFQLLGATCLHVASKCEDVSYIGVEDLAMCADNVYTSVEVLQMEEKLLNSLNFGLAVPTSLDFLNIIEALMPPLEHKTVMLAQYLAELALQEYQFLKYLPSLVATCCISLAHYCVSEISWTTHLEQASQYQLSDLKDCMLELQAMYSSSAFTVLAVVKKRYMKQERCQVAALIPPSRYNIVFS